MDLPYEINFKIFTHLIPDETCDINAFREYFLVSKYFYNILNSYEFKIIFSKKIELYDTLLNINSPEYLKDIISSYKNIILYSYNKFVVSTYNEDLIKSIGLTNLINLPVCKFNKSKCIDNKCSFNNNKCYYKCHSLTNYITDPLMRGVDDLGNRYVLFVYKNLDDDKLKYEFIYNKIVNNKILVTYSGIYNNTYIGMLSDNKLLNQTIYDRQLTTDSYNYIERLINNDRCSIPKYNSVTDSYNEIINDNRYGNITLYY
jgi:hypothetical protein